MEEFKYLVVLSTSDGRRGAGDRQTDWCCGCSDLDAVPVRRGEERIERKKKKLSI